MWRPDLHPLPCRQNVNHITGADGRRSFAVREAIPSGTVLEISLCLEVPAIIVDQLPFLRDFVLTGKTENQYILVDDTLLSPLAHIPLFFLQIKWKAISENMLNWLNVAFPQLTLFLCPNP